MPLRKEVLEGLEKIGVSVKISLLGNIFFSKMKSEEWGEQFWAVNMKVGSGEKWEKNFKVLIQDFSQSCFSIWRPLWLVTPLPRPCSGPGLPQELSHPVGPPGSTWLALLPVSNACCRICAQPAVGLGIRDLFLPWALVSGWGEHSGTWTGMPVTPNPYRGCYSMPTALFIPLSHSSLWLWGLALLLLPLHRCFPSCGAAALCQWRAEGYSVPVFICTHIQQVLSSCPTSKNNEGTLTTEVWREFYWVTAVSGEGIQEGSRLSEVGCPKVSSL